ncbi:MAG TPA: heavy metal-binding domain-containing protein [Chthoniobacterales bacterium]|nr:heavy metal-binding domain-containing protein [Chthoniobacterales bacterium]
MAKSKTRTLVLAAVTTLLWSVAAYAQHAHGTSPATTRSEILPVESRTAGKSVSTVIRLTGADGKPLSLEQLEVAHTEKIHLLVIDQSLTDYHHLHPVAGDQPGEYRFEFAPRFGGAYHIWADLVPKASGKQEYSKTTLKVDGPPASSNTSVNTTAEVDGYRFDLKTENDAPLQAGKETVVKVKVTGPDGREFSKLEPVMGAFAHMVAFPADLASVTHVHPMGAEPKTATERGGPELSFHVQSDKAGYHKFFLQTQIDGKDKFAAFGLKVEPAATAKTTSPPGTTYVCPMHPEVKQQSPGKCPKCGMALVAK